ncbi:MAG: (d)CMP kinase [Rikenellaceae bacterium]
MSNKKIIIAIDGFSSCGKSTFAKLIASKIDYKFIDSGAMYRSITLYALNHDIIDSEDLIVESLKDINIEFKNNPQNGKSEVSINGESVEGKIRDMRVSEKVSYISSIAQVRTKVSSLLQQMGEKGGIVMDGRDIGSAVFPHAELKIFMTADPKVRAKRRFLELEAKGITASLEEIEQNINQRDYQDQNRKESPLVKASDAIELDNSYMSLAQQMEWVEELICQRTK